MEQSPYVGLDVSQELTSVCVIDQHGSVIWRGKCGSDPGLIAAAIRRHAPRVARVGLETGLLSNFLTRTLRARGVPVVCIDARHAKAALRLQINKTGSASLPNRCWLSGKACASRFAFWTNSFSNAPRVIRRRDGL